MDTKIIEYQLISKKWHMPEGNYIWWDKQGEVFFTIVDDELCIERQKEKKGLFGTFYDSIVEDIAQTDPPIVKKVREISYEQLVEKLLPHLL